eukprot:6189971-Pleurochrysis_carterae.AAC.1
MSTPSVRAPERVAMHISESCAQLHVRMRRRASERLCVVARAGVLQQAFHLSFRQLPTKLHVHRK